MRNYEAAGKTLTLIAPSGGVTAGTPVIIGGTFAIPISGASEGDEFVGYVDGIYTLTKTAGFAPAAGDVAYWDADAGSITNSDDDTAIGVFAQAAASGAVSCSVRLNGTGIAAVPEVSGGAGTLTTGYVTCTGTNNVSSVPSTFRYIVGLLEKGQSVTVITLSNVVVDGVAADLSGATYTISALEGGSETELAEWVEPEAVESELEILEDPYTAEELTLIVVDVSGLADSSVVVFKIDAVTA
jgi:predicted RecA/RadA family phage recombinase